MLLKYVTLVNNGVNKRHKCPGSYNKNPEEEEEEEEEQEEKEDDWEEEEGERGRRWGRRW